MASKTYEEVLKFVIKAGGDEELVALVREMANLGEAGEEAEGKVAGLLEELGNAKGLERTAAAFREQGREVLETTQRYDQAKAKVSQLAEEMAKIEQPTARQEAAFRRARGDLERIGAELTQSRARWAELRGELDRNGVAARSYSQLQAQITARQQAASDALREYARETVATRNASAQTASRIAEGDEAFRRQASSSRTAAEALRAYRQRVAEAAQAQRDAAADSGRLGQALGSIRAIAAGAAAALGIGSAVDGIKNLLGVAAASENARRALQNLYGSQAAGNAAFERLREMSASSGVSFNVLAESAKKLKAFGIDPLNGTLQAFIDQNAAVGGSQEELEGKLLAVGQAWAKQKLQGEEILQLVERGVPVWDLLQKATGKNVAELQKLSESGRLGRETIKALIDELGRANSGAAQASLSGLSGLMAQISARWVEFQNKVADAGVADYFKRQMQSLLGSTGDMDAAARKVSDGIIGAVEAVKAFGSSLSVVFRPIADLTAAIARNGEAIGLLAKLYVATKLTQWAGGLLAVVAATDAATAATARLAAAEAARASGVGTLRSRLNSMPSTVVTTFAAVGLTALLHGVDKLKEGLDARRDALRANETLERADAELKREQLKLGEQLQAANQKYAGVALKSANELRTANAAQAAEYLRNLEGARAYNEGVIRAARAAGEAQREAAAHREWRQLGVEIAAVNARIKDLQFEAAGGKAGAAADAAVAKFEELRKKGEDVKKAVSGLFDGMDLTTANGVAQAAAVLEAIEKKGGAAAKAIREELSAQIKEVTTEDLPKLKGAAEFAMETGAKGAANFGKMVNAINLERLGVELEEVKTGFTSTGRQIVDTFRGAVSEVDKLGLTAEQKSHAIATAFDNAFRQASTKSELEALRAALQKAMSDGSISFESFQKRVEAVNGKLDEMSGKARNVGQSASAGASQASAAFENVAAKAESYSNSVQWVSDSTASAGEKSKQAAKDVQAFGLVLGSVSEQFTRAAMAANRYVNTIDNSTWRNSLNRLTAEYDRQYAAVQKRMGQLDGELAKYDELSERIAQLRVEFKYLGEDQLRALAEKEKQVADLAKQAEEAAAQAREAELARYSQTASESSPQATASVTRRANEAVAATAEVLDQAERAAAAIGTAAARMTSAAPASEIVIRIVSDAPAGAMPLKLTSSDIKTLTAAIMRELSWQRSLTR